MLKPRTPSFHKGRWQVERERCHIAAHTPTAPMQEPQSCEALVTRLLRRLGAEDQPWLSELEKEWPELVGATIAQHTRPGNVIDKTLLVYVDHSIWLQELSRNSKTLIIARLGQRFGHTRIRDILLRIDPKPCKP